MGFAWVFEVQQHAEVRVYNYKDNMSERKGEKGIEYKRIIMGL